MATEASELPLNAIRAFVMIAREGSVTRAAEALGITQSSVSRYLSVLEEYLGEELIKRQGRNTELTDFGRLFASTVSEPLDVIAFTARRMRKRGPSGKNRIIVSSSLPTFAYTMLIPRLQEFTAEAGGAVVDVMISLSQPTSSDGFDVLLTRDLALTEPSDHWDIYQEHLVCVGAPGNIAGMGMEAIRSLPVLTIMSRPDILPAWLKAHGLTVDDINAGARYAHHYLALPALATGKCLLVAPEIVVGGLVREGMLKVVAGSRVPSGMQYSAFAVDRSEAPELARAFCRWLVRLCRAEAV